MGADQPWGQRLECPIPSLISPHADAVQEWLADWVPRFGLPLDETGRKRLARGRFARYAGRLYPEASLADLRCLAALFTWFFLLDDACDGPDGPRPEQVAGLRDEVPRLLRIGPRARQRAFTGPLRQMLVDAWRLPRRRMPASWRARFVGTVAHHLDGVLTETGNKAAGRRPGVTEYLVLRRATSAAYVSYALIEFATHQYVPDIVYHHPAVREVAEAGNDLLSWFNDLISLRRDSVASGGHNLVLAVAREDGVPVETAVRTVTRRWRERMRRFIELRAAVPSFGPAVDESLRRHLDGVANSVRGTIDWSLESGRYREAEPAVTVPRHPGVVAETGH